MRTAAVGVLFLLAVPPCTAQVQILEPQHDTIVLDGKIIVRGTAGSSPTSASLKVSVRCQKEDHSHNPVQTREEMYEVPVNAETWEVMLDLPIGTTLVTATVGDESVHVLITRGTGIARCSRQKVWLRWEEPAIDRLAAIARDTLTGPLLPEDELKFAREVPQRVRERFLAAYKDFDVELVDTDGADVHTLLFVDEDVPGGGFGSTDFCDCGNSILRQTSEISVRAFHRSMAVEDFAKWKPMKKDDPPEVRIEDVAQALARTAAHELGHGMGLVGAGEGESCSWMLGCPGNHNCPGFTSNYPMVPPRHKNGWCIMDEGNGQFYNARLAEPNPNGRTSPRVPAGFSPFNRAYLAIVHPK